MANGRVGPGLKIEEVDDNMRKDNDMSKWNIEDFKRSSCSFELIKRAEETRLNVRLCQVFSSKSLIDSIIQEHK